MDRETKEQSSQEETKRHTAVVTPSQRDVVAALPTNKLPNNPFVRRQLAGDSAPQQVLAKK